MLLLVSSTAMPASKASGDTAEYQLKAAFIHNFARMVKWPDTLTSTASKLQLCVAEPEASDGEVTETVYRNIHGKDAQGLEIEVSTWKEEDAEECHIVFFVGDRGVLIPEMVEDLASRNVLTIGEIEPFAREGGVFNFVTVGSKVRFELNPDAADRSDLVVNSQLVRLATIVHDPTTNS